MGGAPSPGSGGKSGSLGGASGSAGSAPQSVAGAGAGISNQGGETNLGGAGSVGGESGDGVGGDGVGGDGGVSPSGRGDINADGCVDLRDWAILGRDFGCSLDNGGDPRADLQHDGWVDELDYIILTEHWYEGDHCGPTCQAGGDGGQGGDSGQGGAGGQGATDLNGDGRVDWDDVAVFAESYGCDDTCAASGADLVPDGCVNDRDLDVLTSELDPDSRLLCSGAR